MDVLKKIEPIQKADLTEKTADKIIELIENNSLLAGDRMPGERLLAFKLGVSRTTLRHALFKLNEKSILVIAHGKNTRIK